MHIGGLDISTTCIGYAAPNGTLHSIRADKLPTHANPVDRARRCDQLANRLLAKMIVNPPHPEFIVIEGYGFGVNASASARLGELGGVIRRDLFQRGIRFVEIPPSSLKLFGANNGGATKELMVHCAESSGGRPRNHDEADAWHARRMGRVAHGVEYALADHESAAIANVGVAW